MRSQSDGRRVAPPLPRRGTSDDGCQAALSGREAQPPAAAPVAGTGSIHREIMRASSWERAGMGALGVPAVALDVPGIRDSVRAGETGWLAKDEGSLSSVLTVALDVLSDPELAAGFSRRAQRWAAGFDWDITVSRILAVLDAERDRLARPDGPATRRVVTADVLRVDAPHSAYSRISQSVRQTDVVSTTDGRLVAFLYGASPRNQGVIAERLKLDQEARVSLASNRDLVLSNRRAPRRPESETGHSTAEEAAGAI